MIEIAIIGIIIALIFDFVNGFNDSANSVATVIGTRVLKPLQAVTISAVANFAGPFVFGVAVATTIIFSGSGVGAGSINSKSLNKKLAKYAALELTAMEKAGAKFLARGLPVAVREEGQKTRTVVIEWPSIEAANAGYNGPDYQAALDALDGSASREFRYVEATY